LRQNASCPGTSANEAIRPLIQIAAQHFEYLRHEPKEIVLGKVWQVRRRLNARCIGKQEVEMAHAKLMEVAHDSGAMGARVGDSEDTSEPACPFRPGLRQANSRLDRSVGRPAVMVDAKLIMDAGRAVSAKRPTHIVACEQLAPCCIEQHPVRLRAARHLLERQTVMHLPHQIANRSRPNKKGLPPCSSRNEMDFCV
jgi:hypothetical protein